MTLPVAIWPYLWLLCASLMVVSWWTAQHASTRALATILAAYVAVKVWSAVFGETDIYLAAAALTWAIAATTVFRLGFATCSGIMVASALCYFWAKFTDAPRVVGSAPFVASDILMVVAMVWIGQNGVSSLLGRIRDVAYSDSRIERGTGVSASQAMERKK